MSIKKIELEQMLKAYSATDIASDFNFNFIIRFRNTSIYQRLNNEAEITFETLIATIQEPVELKEDYLFSKSLAAVIYRRLKYENQITFADETPIEELAAIDRIILDNYVFSVEELKSYAEFCSEKFNVNPYLRQQNNLFSEAAWEKLKAHNILKTYVKKFEDQKSFCLSPAMLDAIKHLLMRLIVEGVNKSQEIQEEFLAFKLSLSLFEQTSLDNYLIRIPLINGGMQNMLFKDALVGGYPKCINITQIFLWQSVIDHLPATTIFHNVIILAVALGFRFNVAGQLLTNTIIAKAYSQQGIIFMDKGQLSLAAEHLKQSIRWNPNDWLVHTDLGIVYGRQKNFVLAINSFNSAIALNNKYEFAYLNRGIAYYQQDKLELAIIDYNKAIELNHKFKPAYYSRGILRKQKNELELAIADFQESITLDDEDADSHYQLGLLFNLMDNTTLALKHFTEAIALNPNHAYAFYNRGMLYEKHGHLLARIDYQSAIKINPNLKVAYQALDRLADKMMLEAAFAERKSFRFLF